ncbi:MAG: single-strand DNA-binding protein [Chlamydiales bacterium]|jgi:single-strand DNA-binding protein
MNIVEIAGRLGADPETRYTPSNQKVTSLRVAARTFKSGKEDTIWWRVTCWGDRFDKMLSYLKKGSAVIIIGELQKPDVWKDRDGNSQVSMELTAEMIKFSPFGKGDQEDSNQEGSNQESGGVGFQKGQQNSSGQNNLGDSGSFGGSGSSVEMSSTPVDSSDDGLPF